MTARLSVHWTRKCEAGDSPPDTGGVAAPSRKRCAATTTAQTGWSGLPKCFGMRSLGRFPFPTTPSAPIKEASRLLLDVASTPPMSGGEWRTQLIHICMNRKASFAAIQSGLLCDSSMASWLEQLNRIAVGIFDLNLLPTGAGFHFISKTPARLFQISNARRQILHLKQHAVPSAGFLLAAVGHGPRSRSSGTAQD